MQNKTINAGMLKELSYDSTADAIFATVSFNRESTKKLLALISINATGKENWQEVSALSEKLSELLPKAFEMEVKPLTTSGNRIEISHHGQDEYNFFYHG